MSDHICPQCNRGRLRRSERRGFWERTILPMFNRYPWRCNFCRARITLSDRGARRLYVQANRVAPESNDHGI